MNTKNTIIFSTAIVLAVGISCLTFLNRYPNSRKGYVEVKGMGQTNFESDLIVWEGSYKRKKANLKEAFAAITSDKKIVEKFLSNNGVLTEEIVFGPVSTEEVFETIFSQNGDIIGQKFMGYNLSQDILIESNNVLNIEKYHRDIFTPYWNRN